MARLLTGSALAIFVVAASVPSWAQRLTGNTTGPLCGRGTTDASLDLRDASIPARLWIDSNRKGIELQRLGRYAEAEAAFLAGLREIQACSPLDIGVPVILNNLGSVYQDLSRVDDAAATYIRAISAFEKICGTEDPVLLQPLINLGSLYIEHGQYSRAKQLYGRILSLRKDDPTAARARLHAMQLLAAALHGQGQYAEAEALYIQNLSQAQSIYGRDSRDAAEVMANLSLVLAQTGQMTEAVSHQVRALSILERVLGSDHPGLVKPLSNLAVLYSAMHRPAEAELVLRRALAIAARTLGEEHESYGTALWNYATVLRQLNRTAEARATRRRAEAILARVSQSLPSRYAVSVEDLRRNR